MGSRTESAQLKDLVFEKKWVYNQQTDTYIVLMKSVSRQIAVPGKTHRSMQRSYCGEDGREVDEICAVHNFPKALFDEYKLIFKWTRNGCPLTDEEIEENTIELSAAQILEMKKFEVLQEVAKREWKETQEDANKWRSFMRGVFDPFKSLIDNWKPEPTPKSELKPVSERGRWMVVVASDWQIGAKAEERYMSRQKEWGTKLAKKVIAAMAKDMSRDAKGMNVGFEGVVILLAGDLHHGLRGETEKGTKLKCDVLRDEQVDAIMDCLEIFINTVREEFPRVVIRAVRGNHDGTDFYPIAKALKKIYREDKNVQVTPYSKRTAVFKVSNTLIILDHGASDTYASDVPRTGKPRESYIQSLILSNKDKLSNVNQILFVQGDKHHFEHIEYNDFEFIMTGALPLGDEYADHGNLHSRARQNSFIIDRDGLKATFHYYVDKYV